MKKPNNHKSLTFFIALVLVAIVAFAIFGYIKTAGPFLDSVKTQLSFGPRFVGSKGHQKVKEYISTELGQSNAKITRQEWVDEKTGETLINFVARFNESASDRIIIATHYDTDPTATKDSADKTKPVAGASDGASGTAVLLKLAKDFEKLGIEPGLGVDIVFFDAENYQPGGFAEWTPKGSSFFSNNLNDLYSKPPKKALVVDMVCDKNLNFKKEKASIQSNSADVDFLWNIGKSTDKEVFKDIVTSEIKDDHTPLIKAGVPSILLIDLDYPYHNTTKDTLDKCSEKSMTTTYEVVRKYIQKTK
ncbi:hypothetical protein LBMAG34_4660 [Candidatus Saccharibacteria bacterium]|nr:hypothetical protein LBMAG34_4660 [Candidatus Saccharibacteria bacterium]